MQFSGLISNSYLLYKIKDPPRVEHRNKGVTERTEKNNVIFKTKSQLNRVAIMAKPGSFYYYFDVLEMAVRAR